MPYIYRGGGEAKVGAADFGHTRDAQPMNSQPGKLSVLPGRVETGGVTPVFYAEPLLLRLYPPDGRKTFALTGRCRPAFGGHAASGFDPKE